MTSAGFWPGNRDAPDPVYYAYAYPTPDGFSTSRVEPEQAIWLESLGEFVLGHDALTSTDQPDALLLSFYESTHAAAAGLAGWDRTALECPEPLGPDWWTDRPHRTS